jgi:RimJ/RimL family protein N-acetyltransferase
MTDTPSPHLRPWRENDADSLRAAFVSTPDLDTQVGGADLRTSERALEFIETQLRSRERSRNWAIIDAGTAVGNVGLSAIERRHDTAWVYYWLADSARGRGLATRALIAVSAHAFADRLFRLELGHRVNNPASCRVATRAGFILEGVERQKLRYGDERFDVELHARLATDPAPHIRPLPLHEPDAPHESR